MIISLKEACERLKIHPNTMYKYLATGQVIGRKNIQGDWQILTASVMQLVDEKKSIGNPIEQIHQLFKSSELLCESTPTPILVSVLGIMDGHFCTRAYTAAVNNALLEHFGYRREDYFTKRCHELYHPDDTEIIHGIANLSKVDESDRLEMRLRCADNKYKWFKSKGSVMQVGGLKVVAAIVKPL